MNASSSSEPNGPHPKNAAPETSSDMASGNPALPADAIDESKPVKELTPEEQMALYEKSLKEDDWGHQPC